MHRLHAMTISYLKIWLLTSPTIFGIFVFCAGIDGLTFLPRWGGLNQFCTKKAFLWTAAKEWNNEEKKEGQSTNSETKAKTSPNELRQYDIIDSTIEFKIKISHRDRRQKRKTSFLHYDFKVVGDLPHAPIIPRSGYKAAPSLTTKGCSRESQKVIEILFLYSPVF